VNARKPVILRAKKYSQGNLMVSRVIPVDDFDLVIFGATGDLARRKILPSLFRRFHAGQMPDQARVIGAARSEHDEASFRAFVLEALKEFARVKGAKASDYKAFVARLDYVTLDARGTEGWEALKALCGRGSRQTLAQIRAGGRRNPYRC
jgi:glucose-6-phosphate 1-dehydrogenase